jgi:inhibitor of cysteine peptidase
MRRCRTNAFLTVALATLAGLGLAACAAPAGSTPAAGEPGTAMTITDADNGKPVQLAVGQQLVVKLGSNPTTGYGWSITQPGTPQLVALGEPVYEQDPGSQGMAGAGGTQAFTFNAEAAGETTLTLAYARPFEPNEPPANTFSVPVTVR